MPRTLTDPRDRLILALDVDSVADARLIAQETWDFVTFMTGKTFQTAVHSNNSPRSDVTTDTKWGKGFTSLASTGVVFPPVSLGAITRDMIASLGRTLLKDEEPEAVAKWLAASINKDLKQSGELSGS